VYTVVGVVFGAIMMTTFLRLSLLEGVGAIWGFLKSPPDGATILLVATLCGVFAHEVAKSGSAVLKRGLVATVVLAVWLLWAMWQVHLLGQFREGNLAAQAHEEADRAFADCERTGDWGPCREKVH
jgi:hypothetical protein